MGKRVWKTEKERLMEKAFLNCLDEEITEADLKEADEILNRTLLVETHTFSPEFEAKMEALFAEARQREAERVEAGLPVLVPPETPDGVVAWSTVAAEKSEAAQPSVEKTRKKMSRALRNGLVAAACLLIVVGVGAVQSIQSGAVFGIEMETFREIYDHFVSVTWGSNEKEANREIVVLELNPLLEEFVETSRVQTDMQYKITYAYEEQEIIKISGTLISASTINQMDGDVIYEEASLIKGTERKIGKNNSGSYCIIWEKNGTKYNVTGTVSKDKLIKIVGELVVSSNQPD